MAKTVRMTTAQAIVKFLDNQYVSMDGVETKFVEGFFTIFGHGIAVGLGEALDTNPGQLKVLQGRNEQGMCHVATAFAKQSNRKKIIACASSIGPGAANMVTACATATVNNIPLLVFPADTFASRQPDPVLQQLEQSSSLAINNELGRLIGGEVLTSGHAQQVVIELAVSFTGDNIDVRGLPV